MTESKAAPRVAILLGSKNDWETMRPASDLLAELGVPHELKVLSAHRAPAALAAYVKEAESRGLKIFVAGAGGAAHLPGVVAAQTALPVLGVPIPSTTLGGLDALLAIVQMPRGVPVGTLAIGAAGAANAALLAAEILALEDPELRERVRNYRRRQTERASSESL